MVYPGRTGRIGSLAAWRRRDTDTSVREEPHRGLLNFGHLEFKEMQVDVHPPGIPGKSGRLLQLGNCRQLSGVLFLRWPDPDFRHRFQVERKVAA